MLLPVLHASLHWLPLLHHPVLCLLPLWKPAPPVAPHLLPPPKLALLPARVQAQSTMCFVFYKYPVGLSLTTGINCMLLHSWLWSRHILPNAFSSPGQPIWWYVFLYNYVLWFNTHQHTMKSRLSRHHVVRVQILIGILIHPHRSSPLHQPHEATSRKVPKGEHTLSLLSNWLLLPFEYHILLYQILIAQWFHDA